MKQISFFTALVLVGAGAAAAEKVAPVPQAFVGQWCGGKPEAKLEIKPNELAFYTSKGTVQAKGPIQAVVLSGDDEVAITARMSGEGQTFTHIVKIKLSKDKKEISVPNMQSTMVGRRCAK